MGIVYSTNPDFAIERNEDAVATPPAKKQKLIVGIDRRQRAGKQVTLISGFVGSAQELENLAKMLKTKCGVGGTAKDGMILIQGDFRDRIAALLTAEGYQAKRGN
ncbi:MAG: translation initiation factor [Prevotellaceae bacterium]|jgi:translation initiation factor 1|nr:translation initiation factor [Prevotellaceae bacterium]